MARRIRTQISQRKMSRFRIRLVSLMFICVFVVILSRLYIIQVIEHKALVEVNEEQIYRTIKIPAYRGEIRDRSGVVLATTVFRETIYMDPNKFHDVKKNVDQTFQITRVMAKALGMQRAELVKKIGKKPTAVARRISPQACEAILKQMESIKPKPQFGAVYSHKEPVRLYPQNTLAANLIGFWTEEKDEKGRQVAAGLESTLDKLIHGEDQEQRLLVNLWGQAIQPLDEVTAMAAYGNTIELTIDSEIQHAAEVALEKHVTMTGGKGGACVVIDPRNGELLAVASYPTFIPGDPRTRYPEGVRNRAFQNAVEPGSVMKIFTYATAADLNLFSPTELVDCEGKSYRFTEGRAGRTITDFHGMGVVPFEKAFWESSNVAAVKLGLRIPAIDFYDKLARLQLTELTQIGFPGEKSGHLTNMPWEFPTRTSVPFGYEVSANSVQMCASIASIANGGKKMIPRIIRRKIDARGEGTIEKPQAQAEVFSQATCQLMTELMEGVVVEGTGELAAVNGYRVAGKTGTTRKTGRPDDERAYLASFAGFLPVSDPRAVIYCWIDEPQKASDSYTGGRAAGPLFHDVAAEAMRVLNVPMDKPLDPSSRPAETESERVEVAEEGLLVSPAMNDTPASGPAAQPYDPVLAAQLGLMPDLVGKTKREVDRELSRLRKKVPDLQHRYYGNGIVLRQDPPPMSPLSNTSECSFHFGRAAELPTTMAVEQGG